MKKLTTLSILFISLVFLAPIQVSAATSAGVKPGSFFYFFDTAFENVGLFFTFNSENKAKKALEHADERLAEAEESASENNPKAVEKAMTGYKEEISLATEKSKGLKDEKKAEELLKSVSESTARHQEVLKGVLEKVPEEAKETILKAIEISKKGQEEATKQIAELKGEVERLKKEVEELKKTKEFSDESAELEKLKKEVETLKEKQKVIQPSAKQPTPTTQNSPEQKKPEEKPKIITLPSGAVVETDVNGNIIRTVKDAPQPQAPKVSDSEFESALTKFYIQSNFDFVRSSISSLLNVAYAQRNSYNAVSKSSSNSCSQYDSAIEDAKADGQRELTSLRDSYRGFASSPYAEKSITDKTARRVQELTDSKDSCLANTPKVDASLSQEIDNAVSRINFLSARANSGPSSVSEMSSVVQEYNSIMQLLVSINYSIPSPASFSSQKISSPGSFSCSSGAGGTGNYSCKDYSSGVSTYCSTSVAGSWSCTNSNAKSVYCRTNALGNGVDCSY